MTYTIGSKRSPAKRMAKPVAVQAPPGARAPSGAGQAERKKLSLKFGG